MHYAIYSKEYTAWVNNPDACYLVSVSQGQHVRPVSDLCHTTLTVLASETAAKIDCGSLLISALQDTCATSHMARYFGGATFVALQSKLMHMQLLLLADAKSTYAVAVFSLPSDP